MPDVFTKAKRSEVMSRIRSRGNQETEVALAKLLRRHGIKGWRRHFQIRSSEFGMRNFRVKPDFVFPKARLAVFVDGCFWHGCPKHATQPKNNRAFWRRKLAGNRQRDRLVNGALRRAGWRVIRIWECALQKDIGKKRRSTSHHPFPLSGRGGEDKIPSCVQRILRALDG